MRLCAFFYVAYKRLFGVKEKRVKQHYFLYSFFYYPFSIFLHTFSLCLPLKTSKPTISHAKKRKKNAVGRRLRMAGCCVPENTDRRVKALNLIIAIGLNTLWTLSSLLLNAYTPYPI